MRGSARNTHRSITSILAALLCLMLAGSALAAGRIDVDRVCSLTIEYKNDAGEVIAGAAFSLYRVGSVSEHVEFTPTDAFERYADFLDGRLSEEGWQALADMLPGYVAMDENILPYRNMRDENCEGVTDENGLLTFEGLETGLYLVVGRVAMLGDERYDVKASLVSLPSRDVNDEWDYELVIMPKSQPLGKEPVDLLVQKNWAGDTETTRPPEITVQLLGDDELIEEIKLNKDNNWQYRWEDIDGKVSWKVIENPVPDGYTPSYSGEGELVIITNTKPDKPSGGPKLPQTGLLWWPVPALALAGMALFALGWARSRRDEG